MTTGIMEFCDGKLLTFVCTVPVSGFQWTVRTLLSGIDGIVIVGERILHGRFTISAQVFYAGRSSSLEVVAFHGLNEVTISCRENGNTVVTPQTAMVTVLGR